MAGDADRDVQSALAHCEEQVEHLKRENRLLREASHTFGALAERLNATLEFERRAGDDRRRRPRGSDRRHPAAMGEQTR